METQHNPDTEFERAQNQLAMLTDEVERNTRILKQSQRRELGLLQAENLAALFAEMTEGLASSYQLQTVSVVLVDPDHDIRHLMISASTRERESPNLMLVESLTGLTPQYVSLPRPWLGPFSRADHQLIFTENEALRSIALIPLRHKETLLGSINFGSTEFERFTRNHATDFFTHLGLMASFALENALNRARLLRSGFTDVLTGWNNRRYLQARLSEEMARARRDEGELTCLMIDVDHFKKINDRFGHAAGDQVLREIAQRIESQVRVSDVAARYGGEEFVVVLPSTGANVGVRLAERICSTVSASPFDLGPGASETITVSIGVAGTTPQRENSDLKTVGDSLLARADVALYRAKSAGRDRVVVERR